MLQEHVERAFCSGDYDIRVEVSFGMVCRSASLVLGFPFMLMNEICCLIATTTQAVHVASVQMGGDDASDARDSPCGRWVEGAMFKYNLF